MGVSAAQRAARAAASQKVKSLNRVSIPPRPGSAIVSFRPFRQIVGIAGYIGAGKTTAAQALVRDCGFVRVRFAGPLKAMLAALGLTPEQLDGAEKERPCDILCGRTPRHAQQTLGTEWGRQIVGDDIWINAWEASACAALDYGDAKGVVADDVRFANEADRIRRLGGIVVAVSRPGVTRSSGHASEDLPFTPDAEIVNDGTPEHLAARIREAAGF